MTTSPIELLVARATQVSLSDEALSVDLADGRSIAVPLAWFPRLLHGRPDERQNWRLIGDGQGIHWPDLDEDISLENLLLGRPSGESQASFRRWLDGRASQITR
jgi:hypothetical protein